MVLILLLPFWVQFELVWQADLAVLRDGKLWELWRIPREVGFFYNTLRMHLARLEGRGMKAKANSACASKLPPNPKRGINTIFNHLRDKPARVPRRSAPPMAQNRYTKPTNTKRGEANHHATSVATDTNELETSFRSRRKTKIHKETETNSVNKNQTCNKP